MCVTNGESKYTGFITIPENITYKGITYNVTYIEDRAFENCIDLSSITIPNSVTSIEFRAFAGWSSLNSVKLGNSLNHIGSKAFYECTDLISVKIPDSVISIEDYAFYGCSMSYMNIPNSVSSIGEGAFEECKKLMFVDFGKGLTSISNRAFYNCDLIYLKLGENVESVGDYAFCSSENLPSVILPHSLTYVGKNAFSGCNALLDVFCYNEAPPTTNNSFDLKRALHVPSASIDLYKKVEEWKDFEYIVSLKDDDPQPFNPDPSGINAIVNKHSNKSIIFDLSGKQMKIMKKGINIINGKKIMVK